MPTFTGKTFATFYKNLFGIDQSSNTGVDSTTRAVQDGAGNNTSISLSDDVLSVQPVNDNTTATMLVKQSGGNNILAVDTTNSKVLVGASQVAANTQYANFAISYAQSIGFLADTHMVVPFTPAGAILSLSLGSSTSSSFNDTNPATSETIVSSAYTFASSFLYLPDNITVDAVDWWHGADTATGDSTAAHLMSYAIVKTSGATAGDLSDGVVVADGATITNAGREQIYHQTMTIQSADVDASRVLIFTFASDTINSDYSINATVKYHIR